MFHNHCKTRTSQPPFFLPPTLAFLALLVFGSQGLAANAQLLGWNNLGMHCMDSDYSVFSILPPYNTVEAQLITGGKLVTDGTGYTVSYEALADPDGSINATSAGKGNFYDFCAVLYGANLPVDTGLLQWPMPGTNNIPQNLLFESTNRPAPGVALKVNWFRAEGIPITPYDDGGHKNPYPLMRLVARNNSGTAIATNDVVLPVSDEMDCRACHASGAGTAARPLAGWVWSTNPERDYRLNILRLHDEHQFADHRNLYEAALRDRGFNSVGLYYGVVAEGKPVLCAVCHASEALGTGSYSNTPPLTASVHSAHAGVTDPKLKLTLDNASHREACYRCHPGAATKCLRGAMGGAIASDGTMEMQCQSCHGNMSHVGASTRVGWFMEPNCQSCHTGTAISNNGQIRYTSAFEPNGAERVPVNTAFATNPNTPAPGLSLYRFSSGHGGLQCSACHGSTHAEFPSTHRNDNLRNQTLQGHAGIMVECTSCHTSMSVTAGTASGGPHGLHPAGQSWADRHGDLVEGNSALRATCANCHGADGKGTVLSRMQSDRVIPTHENKYGTKQYWRQQTVSCYDCHNGPNSDNSSTHPQAVAVNVTTNTMNTAAVAAVLQAQGSGTLSFRVVSQPLHGSVGISNHVAIYFPEPGYVGTDQFTFCAWNGWVDSTLGTCTVSVAASPVTFDVTALVPPDAPAGWFAPFSALPGNHTTPTAVSYDWDFGDGSPHGNGHYVSHAYTQPGTYHWSLVASVGANTAATNGTIEVQSAAALRVTESGGVLTLTWAKGSFDAVVESSSLQAPSSWSPAAGQIQHGSETVSFTVPTTDIARFFRLRKVL